MSNKYEGMAGKVKKSGGSSVTTKKRKPNAKAQVCFKVNGTIVKMEKDEAHKAYLKGNGSYAKRSEYRKQKKNKT